jgi:DNA-directed RNA polymerase sigma subunit (sigma70/sigma32)
MWVDFPAEYNCCLISIYENGSMTLREIGERLHISFARVKQIESDAVKKIRKWEGVRE